MSARQLKRDLDVLSVSRGSVLSENIRSSRRTTANQQKFTCATLKWTSIFKQDYVFLRLVLTTMVEPFEPFYEGGQKAGVSYSGTDHANASARAWMPRSDRKVHLPALLRASCRDTEENEDRT